MAYGYLRWIKDQAAGRNRSVPTARGDIVDEFGYITQNRGRFKPFMPGSAATSSPRPERQKMEDIVASPPPVCYILIIGAPATIHDFQEVR
jgi:hypothetical protein